MRFGVAVADITPPFPMPMGGYAARTEPFTAVHDPLSLSVVILDDGAQRLALLAADLVEIPRDRRQHWLAQVARAAGCPVDQVMINASHTHGGPAIPDPSICWNWSTADLALMEQYANWLELRITATVQEAAQRLAPGSLWHGVGRSAVPMNRRLEVNGRIELAPNPHGEVDDQLHVLALRDAAGALAAVLTRLSCHPVATGAQRRITADFVGAWRQAMRAELGEAVTPIFLQGAGGDMRPRQVADGTRWRIMPHDELPTIGRQLCHETCRTLDSALVELQNLRFHGSTQRVELPCEPRYTTPDAIGPLLQSPTPLLRKYARVALEQLAAGGAIPTHIALDVQTLWLNEQVVFVTSNCELLVGLARALRHALQPATVLVLGYTNGCATYVPDTHELQRGGYEADGWIDLVCSGSYQPGIEQRFIAALQR